MAELGARLVLEPARYHRSALELDERFGFRGVPHAEATRSDARGSFDVRLNASGLRGAELPEAGAAPSAARRIAFVGDSFLVAEALRDEQLVTSRVRVALRERGESVEVYNLSTVDTGTAQQLLMLREYGPRIQPTEVVLFLYSGNDLINNTIELAGRSVVSAGDYIRPYLVDGNGGLERTYTHPLRAWLRHHSRLFAEVERRLLGLGSDVRFEWLAAWPEGLSFSDRLANGLAPSEDLEVLRDHDPGSRWAKAWRGTERLLVAFRDECDELGARLLVVVVPGVHEVMRTAKGVRLDVAARALARRPVDVVLDWDLPARRFQTLGEAHGIDVWPLLIPLRKAAEQGAVPYGRDDHLSAQGHEVAEQGVLAWLDGAPALADSHATRGRPVWMIPESPSLAWLDFERDEHAAYLGDGWIRFGSADDSQPTGWTIGPRALLVLRRAGNDLVVRGEVPSELTLPVRGAVALDGAGAEPFEIAEAGPFEARVDLSKLARAPFEGLGGLVPIEIRSSAVEAVDERVVGLRIRQVGFEAAAPR